MKLDKKIAIVTGAAQGLGAALCERLASEGCSVAVCDLNKDGAEETAAAISEKTGRDCIAIGVDVSDESQVEAMVSQVMDRFGRIDVAVSNAGVLVAEAIDEFPADKWNFVVKVNLFGYFLICKHVCAVMKKQNSGAIVQINSKSGKKGSFKNSAYAASKFGGIGLTQSVALEMAPHNVRVNAICPGNLLDSPLWVNSLYKQYAKKLGITEEEVRQKYIDQVPMRRGCTYDDIADALVFLASDSSSYMTGQAINVTGGQQMD